jgi:hypothetical protein
MFQPQQTTDRSMLPIEDSIDDLEILHCNSIDYTAQWEECRILNFVEPASDVVISPMSSFSIARPSALCFWRSFCFIREVVFRPVPDSFVEKPNSGVRRRLPLAYMPMLTHYFWTTGKRHEWLSSERPTSAAVKAEMSTLSMSICIRWEWLI